MKAKKSRKKTLLIALIVVFVVIALVFVAGYILLNNAFSILTESLYDDAVQKETVLQENKASATALPQEEGKAEGADPKEGGKPAGKTVDELAEAQKKFGISGSMNFSAETVKKLEKSISLGDKLAVMAVISKSLSQSDYQTLLAMTGGGITRDEISQAFSILRKSLGAEAKAEVYRYYQKYAYLLEEN